MIAWTGTPCVSAGWRSPEQQRRTRPPGSPSSLGRRCATCEKGTAGVRASGPHRRHESVRGCPLRGRRDRADPAGPGTASPGPGPAPGRQVRTERRCGLIALENCRSVRQSRLPMPHIVCGHLPRTHFCCHRGKLRFTSSATCSMNQHITGYGTACSPPQKERWAPGPDPRRARPPPGSTARADDRRRLADRLRPAGPALSR